MSEDLHKRLADYVRARRADDPHALRAHRRDLLPLLHGHSDSLTGRGALASAIAVLEDTVNAAIGAPAAEDTDLRDALEERLLALRQDPMVVPILLVDLADGAAVADELAVEILHSPGARGHAAAVWTAQAVDDEAEAAASNAFVAATALLRRLGWEAEPQDLDVGWSTRRTTGVRIEGPSLGLALALAVVSRGTRTPLPAGVAVTGAVSVDGRVQQVEGLEQKARAAADAGFERLVVPTGAGGLVGRWPDGLQIVEVATLQEAVSALLSLGLRRAAPRLGSWFRQPPLLAAVVLTVALFVGALEPLAVLAYPAIFGSAPPPAISDSVVLVPWDRTNGTGDAADDGVDFSAIAENRSYRQYHPRVLDRLVDAGAAVIVLDAWISGGEVGPLAAAFTRARDAGVVVVVPALEDGGRWERPAPELEAAATSVGSASARREGLASLVRGARIASAHPDEGEPRWSIALLAVAGLEGDDPVWTAPGVVRVGERTFEVDGDGVRLVPFPSAPDYRRYAYADVWAGRFDPAHVRGRIVMLGATWGDRDRHPTPTGAWYGVEIQAAVVDSLLSDSRIEAVAVDVRAGLIGLFALALLASVAALRYRERPLRRLAITGLALAGAALFASTRFMADGSWWPWTDAVTLIVVVVAIEFGRARDRGRRLSGAA